jgi:long-chain acyl-CoA synthetase
MPARDPIVQAFEEQVQRRQDAPLVFTADEIATVGAIDDLARGLARSLEEMRLPGASLVGLTAPNGPGVLAAFIAVRRLGLVPLLMDPSTPPAEQARSGRRLQAAALLRVGRPWPRERADWHLEAIADVQPVALPGFGAVKLTSGSTGEPRGVANSADSLVADSRALKRTMGFRDDDRLLASIPMTHSYGLSCLLLQALLEGLPLVLPQADAGPIAPLAAAHRHLATVFPTAPAYLQALLRLPEAPAWPPSLRLVLSAGAPLHPATAAGFRERFGLVVHVFYGASEAGGICFDREGGAAERGSVGAPVEGVRIEIEPHPGERGAGLVSVRSSAVASTYLPQGSARLADGCFVSDDLGRIERGELTLLGRRSEWINIDGHKVEPREVEAVLRSLPGVEDAVVVGAPLPGRAGESLWAIVAAPSRRVTYFELVDWCRARLAPHKVPRRVRIVDALPRTARGKVDRDAILGLTGALDPASSEA